MVLNPAWPGFCKMGRTTNVSERLRGYQTGSPHRDYQLHYQRYFPDVCRAERTLRRLYSGPRFGGEWFQIHPDDAASLVDLVAKRLGC